MNTLSPMVTRASSRIVRLKLPTKLWPMDMLNPKSHLKGECMVKFSPMLPTRFFIIACFFGGLRWWQAVEHKALLFAPEQVAGYVRPDVVAPYAVAQHFVWVGIAMGVLFGHG